MPVNIEYSPAPRFDDYITKTNDEYGTEITLVTDYDGMRRDFGFDEETDDDFRSFLNERLGEWDLYDYYILCDSCGTAFMEPTVGHLNMWISDEGAYCYTCVHTDDYVRDLYLDFLTNNDSACNTILSDAELKDAGYVPVDIEDVDGTPARRREVLELLRDKYPSGEFIFSEEDDRPFTFNWRSSTNSVWALDGYDSEVIEDERQQD